MLHLQCHTDSAASQCSCWQRRNIWQPSEPIESTSSKKKKMHFRLGPGTDGTSSSCTRGCGNCSGTLACCINLHWVVEATQTFLRTHCTPSSVKVTLVDINRGNLLARHGKGLPGQIVLPRRAQVELIYEINSTPSINMKIVNFESAVTNLEFTVISKLNNLLTTD